MSTLTWCRISSRLNSSHCCCFIWCELRLCCILCGLGEPSSKHTLGCGEVFIRLKTTGVSKSWFTRVSSYYKTAKAFEMDLNKGIQSIELQHSFKYGRQFNRIHAWEQTTNFTLSKYLHFSAWFYLRWIWSTFVVDFSIPNWKHSKSVAPSIIKKQNKTSRQQKDKRPGISEAYPWQNCCWWWR